MRVPLQSMIYLVQQILIIIAKGKTLLTTDDFTVMNRFGKIITSQLSLMEAFVEDMLNLSKMRKGCFALVKDAFDPLEALNFVKQIFLPKADAKEIKLRVYT